MINKDPAHSRAEELFFELLKAAIWNQKPDVSLFSKIENKVWNRILWLAKQQGVPAMIADRLLLLPIDYLPSYNCFANQMRTIKNCSQMNSQMTQTLDFILKSYSKLRIPAILLKGLGNAQAYPFPELRIPGDIDLFLFQNNDYDKANQWVKDQGYTYHVDPVDVHRAFDLEYIRIENHKNITFFPIERYNTRLNKLLEAIDLNSNFEELSIEGVKVKTLPPDINALYIFQHLFFHFIHEGVGLRQIIDWVLHLAKYHDKIDPKEFTTLAKSFNLLYPMQVFAETTIQFLGAPRNIFPFPIRNKSRYPEKIIRDIMSGGEFGFHHPVRKKIKNESRWKGWWRRYKRIIGRTLLFHRISPSYFWSVPIHYFEVRVKKMLKIGKYR